jgi:L-iditol 2-dehydrogenase
VNTSHYGFNYKGAYAQYNAYNVKALTKMPDNVSFEEGSLVDTGGTALQAIRLNGITPGGYSVIFGEGPVGIFLMKIAKAMGSNTIVIGCKKRLKFAKEAGADYIVDYKMSDDVVAEVRKITGGLGADEAFECAGSQDAMLQCVRCVKKNGQVAIVSLPIKDEYFLPVKTMVMNQITIHGSRANPNCSKQVLAMINEGKVYVKDMITNIFSLDDVHKAIDIFSNKIDGVMKVVIRP